MGWTHITAVESLMYHYFTYSTYDLYFQVGCIVFYMVSGRQSEMGPRGHRGSGTLFPRGGLGRASRANDDHTHFTSGMFNSIILYI